MQIKAESQIAPFEPIVQIEEHTDTFFYEKYFGAKFKIDHEKRKSVKPCISENKLISW